MADERGEPQPGKKHNGEGKDTPESNFQMGKMGEIEPTKLSGKSLCKENKTPRRPEQETLELSTRGMLFMIMWGCLEAHQYKTCFERPKIFMNTFRN